MKVSKQQLKRIIREEKTRLAEQYKSGTMRAEQIVDMLHGKGEPHADILRFLYSEIPGAVIPVLEKYAMDKGVNIRTESRLRRTIRRSLKENRGNRLTLWVRATPSGSDLELYVNESGEAYNFGDYVYDNNLAGLMKDFEADHGMPIPAGTMAVDYEGMGMGDLPIEKMFQAVAEEYGAL